MTQRIRTMPLADLENEVRSIKSVDVITKNNITKRTALGEVGNKLHVQRNGNEAVKKGVMGPPAAIPKKPLIKESAIVQSAPVKKTIEKVVLKRQESLFTKSYKDVQSFSSQQLCIIDPDADTKNDPQMVTEYLADIFSYLREQENKFLIRENHLDKHCSKPHMRSIVVNWIVEVHQNFKLCLETLHLCVGILDHYLQDNKHVGKDTLQLVGTSALLLACKYEEMYLHELDDFCYICDNTFTKRQILQMEREILKKIDFNLGRPLSLHFYRRYNRIAKVTLEQHNLGKYILELALLEYTLCPVKPSIVAAAACCLSIALTNDNKEVSKVWTPTLQHYTTYAYNNFRTVLHDLAHLLYHAEESKYQSVRKKYASSKYIKISLNPVLKGSLIQRLAEKSSLMKK